MGFLNVVVLAAASTNWWTPEANVDRAPKGDLYDDAKVVTNVDESSFVHTNEFGRTHYLRQGELVLDASTLSVPGATAAPGVVVIGNKHKTSNYSGYLMMGHDTAIYAVRDEDMASLQHFDEPGLSTTYETLDARYDRMARKIFSDMMEGRSVTYTNFLYGAVGRPTMDDSLTGAIMMGWYPGDDGIERHKVIEQVSGKVELVPNGDGTVTTNMYYVRPFGKKQVDVAGLDENWRWRRPFWTFYGYASGLWLGGPWSDEGGKDFAYGVYADPEKMVFDLRDANHPDGGELATISDINSRVAGVTGTIVSLGNTNTTAKTVNVGTNTLESVIDAVIADKGLTDGFWLSEGVTTLDTTDIPGVGTVSASDLDPDSAGRWTVDYSWVTNGVVVYQTDVRETDEGAPIAGKLPLIRAGVPYDTPDMNEVVTGYGGVPGSYNSSFYHPFSRIYEDQYGGSVKATPPLFYGASLMLASPEYKPDAIWLWRGSEVGSGLPRWLLSDEDVRQHFVESVDFSTGVRRFTDPWLFYGIDRTADLYATEGYNMYGVRWMPDEFATISTLMGDDWYAGSEVYQSGDFGERIATLPEVGRRLGHMLSRISVDDPAMRHWGFTNVVQIGDATVTADVLKVGTNTLREVIETLAPVPDTSAFVTKTELDSSVKTAVNKYKDLEYDTALEVTWTRVVNDGHIYYIAVTNVNTSVAE